MANPHIGVSLPTMVDPTPTQLADFAVRAESLGYDSLWAGDTLLRPVVEPLTALAAVSGVTSTIGLGTAAMLPAFRSPVQAAQTLASLDVVSGGRLTVAVGAGFPGRSEAEYAWSGVPWARRFTRLDETVEFWRRMWTATEPVSFHGKVLRFDDVPPVTRPHGIPVWLAGASPRALERTGRLYDGWLPYPPTPEEYAEGLTAVRAAGRNVTAALFVSILITDSVAAGEAALDEYTRGTYGKPLEVVRTIQLLTAGPVDHVREVLARYEGVDHFVVRVGALDADVQADQLPEIARVFNV
jgi:alkanesulfonate monooxygenase SsuD/methylene tetrahydromethanopterin reductase-like flavin-dependent oxidoreductase (luciferase family)